MSENNNMEDRIDKYLLGQMSEEERSTFEKELSADDILKQEVEAAALVSSSVCRNKVKDILHQAEAEYQLEMEERIDTYIMGRMSPSEAIEFEMELKENTSLKEKYDAQKQVASAVKRLQLKALMEEAEAEIAAEPERESIFKRIFGSIEIKFEVPAVRRAAYSFAVAASLALVAGIGFDMQQTSVYRNTAEGLMAEFSQARGGSDIDDLLDDACTMITDGDSDSAIVTLEEAISMIESELKEVDTTTEEGQYDILMLTMQRDDAEWYKAVALMKDGKHRQAKKQLKAIVAAGNRHAEEAARILDKNKLF